MKYKSQTIPLVLSLSLAAVLILGTAVPQPSAMAMEIPELQDPGISPLDDSPPPLPTDGVKKVDGLSSGADVPPPHSDPKPEEYPIPNSEMPTMEDHHVVSRRDLSAEGSSIQVPAAPDGWTTIMFEDFEGAFPGAGWNVYDSNSTDNMEYYWDDDDYRAHNGSWSAWPANGGADGLDPLFFYYPDNMDTWMWYGPFDLSDAVDAELQFYYWLQSEWSYDFFSWYASPDGGADITGYIRSGSSGGWVSENYDLTAFLGDASVWISFHFESDATNTDEGVYVDDILLRKKLSRPDIYISPTSLTSKQAPDQVKTLNLEIGNNGDAPLDWSIVESNTVSCIPANIPWLSVIPYMGTIAPASMTQIYVTFDSHGLGTGIYQGALCIYSNDPDEERITIPITLDTNPDANLTPYKPGSWAYPIVPSTLTGTNIVNDLYVNMDTYIDWAVINSGTEDILAQFQTCLYFDSIEIYCWYTNGKNAGNIASIEDWVLYLVPAPGWHNLKIVTDVYDDVNETNETDNTWAADFFWNPSPNAYIYTSPPSLTSQQTQDQVMTLKLEIHNYGSAPLDWSIHESPTGSCLAEDIPWVSESPDMGTTAPVSMTQIDVIFDSTGLATGTYQGVLCISSNDPDEPLITVPITLETIEELTIFLPMLFRP